jgi:hypothetical protein
MPNTTIELRSAHCLIVILTHRRQDGGAQPYPETSDHKGNDHCRNWCDHFLHSSVAQLVLSHPAAKVPS